MLTGTKESLEPPERRYSPPDITLRYLQRIRSFEISSHASRTIGFTQKSAAQFFTLLKQAEVRTLLDVRLNNTSQLAGFSKKPDLEFFLSELLDIRYVELRELAPERDHLKRYRSGDLSSKTCRRILEFTMVQSLEHRTFTVTTSRAHFLSAIGNAHIPRLNGLS
ncbi:DUF488 family protein [Caballeronia sp. M23-90]